ncbi:hypothetical protein [Nonomuraea sp. NPDC049504]|uniref:hypothetical protein n=1 Tax=Nonomuraea sp. NPDC049504 TaxID=3154729 RepID=UPI00343AF296
MIAVIRSSSSTRHARGRLWFAVLAIVAAFHLLLCGFGPHAHDGLPSPHHTHAIAHADGSPDHKGDDHHHAASCQSPAALSSPDLFPAGAVRPVALMAGGGEELTARTKPGGPSLTGSSSGASLLTVVCVSRV